MNRSLEDYRRLPYQRVFDVRDEDGDVYFLYSLVELPAVVGDGRTKDLALQNLKDCFDDYVGWRLEDGLTIEEPSRPSFEPDQCEILVVTSVSTEDRATPEPGHRPPTGPAVGPLTYHASLRDSVPAPC